MAPDAMPPTEETKAAHPDDGGDDAPFVEELTEEEALAEEMMSSATLQEEEAKSSAPDDGDEDPTPSDPHETALHKIMAELDQIEAAGKEGYVHERYNYAYSEYKRGLKSLSDLVMGREAREDGELKARYMVRRRKFAANAAAACIKIGYYQQGLEASKLILDEGADDEMQRRKALFRAGVCARGMGDLDDARGYLRTLLEVPDLDGATQRDVRREWKRVAEEEKRYRKFAKRMVSKEHEESIVLPEKKAPTPEELEKLAEMEEKRREYQERKRREDEDNKVVGSKPEVLMKEEDCIRVLDVLAERYADEKIQEELKQAAYDHEMKFSKGFVIRSRMILAPLQQDLLVKYGFLDPSDAIVDDAAGSGSILAKAASKSGQFEKTLDDLVLIGEGCRERSEDAKIYSVALYSGELVKESISSENKAEITETLRAALNIAGQTTILLVLSEELKVHELTGEIIELVSGHVSNNALLANISSIFFGTERATFNEGTAVRFDCTSSDVKISIDGKEIGTIGGLSGALFDAYLCNADASPSLRQSVRDICGKGERTNPQEAKTSAGPEANDQRKAANEKAHFKALGMFQHNVRYLSQNNKDIAEKATLCRKLAVGLLYDDSMDVTGWVSL